MSDSESFYSYNTVVKQESTWKDITQGFNPLSFLHLAVGEGDTDMGLGVDLSCAHMFPMTS